MTAESDSRPANCSTWQGLPAGAAHATDDLSPDQALEAPGTYIWWNPERNLVVGHHEETRQKSKALGHIKSP